MASPSSSVDAPLGYVNSDLTAQSLVLLVVPACVLIVVILLIPFILMMLMLWKFRRIIKIRIPGQFRF